MFQWQVINKLLKYDIYKSIQCYSPSLTHTSPNLRIHTEIRTVNTTNLTKKGQTDSIINSIATGVIIMYVSKVMSWNRIKSNRDLLASSVTKATNGGEEKGREKQGVGLVIQNRNYRKKENKSTDKLHVIHNH